MLFGALPIPLANCPLSRSGDSAFSSPHRAFTEPLNTTARVLYIARAWEHFVAWVNVVYVQPLHKDCD